MPGENGNGAPDKLEKGYQPAKPAKDPGHKPQPDGGYQPTQQGDNPTSVPPKGDE